MILTFKEKNHEYKSLGEDSDVDWIGVTTLVSHFKRPFDSAEQSLKSSLNKRSKWYGLTAEEVQALWKAESDRASTTGTWYHDQREKDLMEFHSIDRDGVTVPIIRPIYKEGVKIAPEQKLSNGVYPEHFVYLRSAGICGQSDRVEVVNDIVSISDYKTNKELKLVGYTNWEGITTMMTGPVSHLDDCHLNHYAIQLSLYLYIIIKHNPSYKPGKLHIEHVILEEDSKDQYGYPIHKRDNEGNYIVKEVKIYEVPYYKLEVINMINYLKDNRELVKSKKK